MLFAVAACLPQAARANAPVEVGLCEADPVAAVALAEVIDFPIFGKKRKTSNKKQLRFAMKRSRRHGKGVMRARKNRGKKKAKQGGRSKKKEGCNT